MPFVARPDGWRLFTEVSGDPRRPALVLLEGLGGDVAGWHPTVSHLARELFVVAYDHRGCGRSEGPDLPTTIGTYVEDCMAVLDELRLGAVHVYGQSFGGAVAIELAITHRERVRTAVLGATHPGVRHAVPSGGRAPKDRPWLQRYAPAFVRDHPEQIREHRTWEGRRSPSGERRQWEALRVWDRFDALPEMSVPVLVLHGSEDRLVHPGNAELLAGRIPRAELAVLDGAGHAYHLERPEEAALIVLDFVRRHRS
jgi:pimeloyl-ACP methyl ester carboxylesterase